MLKKTGVIFLLCMLQIQSVTAAYLWRQNHEVSQKIGDGFITAEQYFTPPCIVPSYGTSLKPAFGTLEKFSQISQAQFENEIFIGGEVNLADLLFFDISARFSVRDFVTVNEERQRHIFKAEIYSGSYALNGYALSDRGKKAQKMKHNPEQVKTMCGDSVVNEVHLGGRLYVMLDFDFKSAAHRIDFNASAEIDVGLATITISLSKVVELILKNSVVSIRVAQIGGDPGLLEKLKKETQVSCRLDHLENCHKAVRKIHQYFSIGFRNQIMPQNYDHELARNGAVIGYDVESYQEVGIAELTPAIDPGLPSGIKADLEKMMMTSAQYTEYKEQMELFLANDPELEKSLRNTYKKNVAILDGHIALLNQFSGMCFRNHGQCSGLMQDLYSRGVFRYQKDL